MISDRCKNLGCVFLSRRGKRVFYCNKNHKYIDTNAYDTSLGNCQQHEVDDDD